MKDTLIVLRDELFNQDTYKRFAPLTEDFNVKFLLPKDHINKITETNMELIKVPTNTGKITNRTKKIPLMNKALHHAIQKRYMGFEEAVKNASIVQTEETFNWYTKQAIAHKKEIGYKLVCTVWENIPFVKNYKIKYELGHIAGNAIPFFDNTRSQFDHNNRQMIKNNVDLFLAVSQRAKEALIIEGYDEKKIEVIMPLIDINQFSPKPKDLKLMKKYGIKKDDIVIGTQVRLVWEKGIYDFIYAAHRLIHDKDLKEKKLKFFILGKGELENSVRSLIKELGIERYFIIEASFLPYTQLPDYHNLIDIFSLNSIPMPYWQEQIGQALIDSMSTKKAVVAALSGAIPEVVGDAALLSQPGDLYDIANKIKKFIVDERLREDYAIKARKRVEETFAAEIINKQLLKAYHSIL